MFKDGKMDIQQSYSHQEDKNNEQTTENTNQSYKIIYLIVLLAWIAFVIRRDVIPSNDLT